MRPQLLDRFGLAVNVGTLVDTETRLKMVLDRMRYDAEPNALLTDAIPEMEELTVRPQHPAHPAALCAVCCLHCAACGARAQAMPRPHAAEAVLLCRCGTLPHLPLPVLVHLHTSAISAATCPPPSGDSSTQRTGGSHVHGAGQLAAALRQRYVFSFSCSGSAVGRLGLRAAAASSSAVELTPAEVHTPGMRLCGACSCSRYPPDTLPRLLLMHDCSVTSKCTNRLCSRNPASTSTELCRPGARLQLLPVPLATHRSIHMMTRFWFSRIATHKR